MKYSRLHYHGTIKFTKIDGLFLWYSYILNDLSNVASVEVDTIENATTWYNYKTKNSSIMSMLCKHARVPYIMTHTNEKLDRISELIQPEEIQISEEHIKYKYPKKDKRKPRRRL